LDQKGELQIVQTKDADNPLRQDLIPLFTYDVWAHA
jgi:superoxide dismutase